MNFSKLLLCFLLGSVTLITSCGDDEVDPNQALNDRLIGDWDVESLRIDGEEFIPVGIQSFTMEYDREGPAEGEADWNITYNPNLGLAPVRIRGDYEIKNNGMEIDFDGDDLDIEIDGDELTLEGTIEGERWEIEAERD